MRAYSHRTQCLQAGADWFFDKSTEFEKMLNLVQQQMMRLSSANAPLNAK
jgi:hypothetical protein